MSTEADGTAEMRTGLSTRGAVLAGVGVVAILALALFTGFWLVPFLQTRNLLKQLFVIRINWEDSDSEYGAYGDSGYGKCTDYLIMTTALIQPESEMFARFRGPERAARRLRTYLRMPRWAAPDKVEAVYLLGDCGEKAVPILIVALGDPPWATPADPNNDVPGTREIAADALRRIGPAAEEAVPALMRRLHDEDGWVRWSATRALGAISPKWSQEVVSALEAAEKDETEFVRKAASEALAKIHAREAE